MRKFSHPPYHIPVPYVKYSCCPLKSKSCPCILYVSHIMKTKLPSSLLRFFCIAVFLTHSVFAAATPEAGMTPQEVRNILGEPQGRMEMGAAEWWVYPRGKVSFRDGKVTEVDLMDAETFAARQVADAEERARRHEEGLALRAERLQDVSFLALPAEERLRYWSDFQNRFPGVDVFTQVATARAEVNALDAARRDSLRLANLEWRVRDAEMQAQQADQRARDAMMFGRNHFQPQVVVWPTFVPHHPHHFPIPRNNLSISYERGGVNFRFDRRNDVFFSDRFGGSAGPGGTSRIGW